MSYPYGCAFKITNKKSKHYGKIGVVIKKTTDRLTLLNIIKNKVQSGEKCIRKRFEVMIVSKKSVSPLTKKELTPQNIRLIKGTWNKGFCAFNACGHGITRGPRAEAVKCNHCIH